MSFAWTGALLTTGSRGSLKFFQKNGPIDKNQSPYQIVLCPRYKLDLQSLSTICHILNLPKSWAHMLYCKVFRCGLSGFPYQMLVFWVSIPASLFWKSPFHAMGRGRLFYSRKQTMSVNYHSASEQINFSIFQMRFSHWE